MTLARQGLFSQDNTRHALAMACTLDGYLRDGGSLDREAWAANRHEFEKHVVED